MQIILLFFIYSFIGRFLEVFHNFIKTGKFVNRGFLIGPYCPIYGNGGVLLYLLTDTESNNIILFFFACMFICGIIEYAISWLMEVMFHARWWDYSNRKFNLNGRICLEHLVIFGFLGYLAVYIIAPNIINFIDSIPEYQNLINIVTILLIIICAIDTIISVKIIGSIKGYIKKINTDGTEKISKKVKKILIEKGKLYARTVQAYSNFKIPEKYIPKIKDKIEKYKNKKSKDAL